MNKRELKQSMPASGRHHDQVERIRIKLNAARSADRRLKVFGAEKHKYHLDSPASERDVRAFEEHYSIELPACYRAFVTTVGNGGCSYRKSAAGPFYGIYPLGEGMDDLDHKPALSLKMPAVIEPGMTDAAWTALTRRTTENITNSEFEAERARIVAGVLPIGSQGCSFLHALVLNGPHRGRVVNLDSEHGSKPRFAFEPTFLDWYERWLEEVISGDLGAAHPAGFGFTMAGNDEHLLRVYDNADDRETKREALAGLHKLRAVSDAGCRKLLEICQEGDERIRHGAVQMLTKFAYPMARDPLRAHMNGSDKDFLIACQCIFWYAKQDARMWVDLLRTRLPHVNTAETFRFVSYLLTEAGVDYGADFIPFCTHADENIRVTAIWSLGKLKHKKRFVEQFITTLHDASPRVVHTTLQALNEVRDPRLLAAYGDVVDRFKTDEHYILTNLEYRLKEMGIASVEGFRNQRG